ncbi:MAG: hypothetical protein FJW20_22090 [Acidimicrobiia bacterium]|nr:hypothetical protein [Acidimicrobiia bacterium]
MSKARFLFTAAALVTVPAAVAQIQITLEGDPPVFRATGSSVLPRLKNPNFSAIFRVSLDRDDVPPMAGDYSVQGGTLIFRPEFPLEPGLTYRAVFHLVTDKVSATFTAPKPKPVSTVVVEQVYPTVETLPENQLKFYIHFSAPMSRGEAYQRLRLITGQDQPVSLPFLELDEELWDRDQKRLTLFFDPGRVKRGLLPNQEVGAPLEEGKRYSLVIDQEWKDAQGVPLKQGFKKSFTVGPADRTPLDPKKWRLTPPLADTATPVLLDFHEPLDAALLMRFIDVIDINGKPVKGTVSIEREETRWTFMPAEPWKAGAYKLEIMTALEDLAGNKIGRAFDVDRFEQVDQTIAADFYTLPFTVR